MARSLGLGWLSLDRSLRLDGRKAVVDLADLVLQHDFPGFDPGPFLWPRYALVLDPARRGYHYAGRRLDIDGGAAVLAMLEQLAAVPGQVVDRDTLSRALWPDEFGARRSHTVDWDNRIRNVVRRLRKALAEAAAGVAGVPPDPIETVRSGSDVEGGYRLALPADRVAWWRPVPPPR